ncbi:hypothetical protein FRC03_002088 [Tulasnella sp. 419]|nr:hypothetical protein FRC03_002088 [Tulasnella sp. 419]
MLNLFNRAFRSPVGPNSTTMQHVHINFFSTAAAYKLTPVAGPSRFLTIPQEEYRDFIDEEEAEVMAYLDRYEIPSGGELTDMIPPDNVPSRYFDLDGEEGLRLGTKRRELDCGRKGWAMEAENQPSTSTDDEISDLEEELDDSRPEKIGSRTSQTDPSWHRHQSEDLPPIIQPRNMYAITLTCDPLHLSPLIVKALHDIGFQYQYQVLFRRRTSKLWVRLIQLRPYLTVQRMTEEKMRDMSRSRGDELRRLGYLRYLSVHGMWREVMEEDSIRVQLDPQEIESRKEYST